jgi:GTP-binding protein
MSSPYQKAYFMLSVAEIKQLPPDEGIEVAIVGRSNAGKSSILNCITHNKSLARVSKTPGRTQMINLFGLDAERRLADLPGYGYAKVPLAAKRKWEATLNQYFEERKSLKGLILVMDSRHPFKPLDQQMLNYCEHFQTPVHILLNKSDKLSKNESYKTLKDSETNLAAYSAPITYQLFSALSKKGLKELHLLLNQWYGYE